MMHFQLFLVLCLPLIGAGCSALFNDESKNIKNLKTDSQNGNRDAQGELGAHYFYKGNLRESLYWLTQAAQQGEVRSQWLLGQLHRDGKGVKQNPVLACQWFILAAGQDYRRAMGDLKELKQNMTTDQITKAEARAKELQNRIKQSKKKLQR